MSMPAALARGGLRAVVAVLIFGTVQAFAQDPPPIAGKPILDPAVMPASLPYVPPSVVPASIPTVAPSVVPAVFPPLTPSVIPPLTPTGGTAEAVPPAPAKPAPLPINAAPVLPGSPPVVFTHHPHLYDSMHQDDAYGLKSLFDTLHPKPDGKGKHWYEKLNLRGYTQFRIGRTLEQDLTGAESQLFGDRGLNGDTETFTIRRMRLILFGDVSEHLAVYIQPDFGVTPPGGNNTFFGQLRDAYGDVYLDKTKVHRLRVGLSKVPYGWENMQSSQNRVYLDRNNAFNSAVPNERDLGVFYYYTPVEKQQLFKDLVDGGLKGSGNYGIFGFGFYNGQASHILEQNNNLHSIIRLTYPWILPSGQVVEASVQAYTGEFVTPGAAIRPLGRGSAITPANTGGIQGLRDQRIAGTFVWYPQNFGFQAEWTAGEGPGLNDAQTAVEVRPLTGGYGMIMYKHDTRNWGIWTPFLRYQYFRGGYKSVANAPYGTHSEFDLGIEWQIRKEMELVLEYNIVDGVNTTAINQAGATSYRNFDGSILRCQFQINY